jgi:hypothetical protein
VKKKGERKSENRKKCGDRLHPQQIALLFKKTAKWGEYATRHDSKE